MCEKGSKVFQMWTQKGTHGYTGLTKHGFNIL